MFLLFCAKASLNLSRVADRSSLTGGTVIARVPSARASETIRNHQKSLEYSTVLSTPASNIFKQNLLNF